MWHLAEGWIAEGGLEIEPRTLVAGNSAVKRAIGAIISVSFVRQGIAIYQLLVIEMCCENMV